MVSFRGRGLREADIDDVVAFVRSVESGAGGPAPEAGGLEAIRVYESP